MFHKLKQIEGLLQKKVGRREVLKGLAVVGAASVSGCIVPENEDVKLSLEKFFQKHYKQMTPADKEKVFARIKKETLKNHGVEINLSDPQALEGVRYAYFLNLTKCNGNRKCVEACIKENNLDRSMHYIKVLEMENGSFNLENGNQYYSGMVPKEGKFYLPVQCNQCDHPPCVRACPIRATWKEKDGIVVIDYDWCIGCRYCQAACPYEARHFNFKVPEVPKEEINTNQSYLSNRIRPRGVVEKCTFCLHRTRQGRYPACLEACPRGARKFGNILDPNSEVSLILKKKRIFVLKEELGTIPGFFYYFD